LKYNVSRNTPQQIARIVREKTSMNIPVERWYPAIQKRRSIRRFNQQQLSAEHLSRISSVCAEFRPFNSTRAVVVTQAPDSVFKGALGSYGKIKGAPAFIAFVANTENPNFQEQAGYVGEGIILEAQSLDLSTCWVGGFFRAQVVASLIAIGRKERILAITPIGYAAESRSLEERVMTGFGLTHKRRPLAELVTGLSQQAWPPWVKPGLEAARLAPSATNRQPWGFDVAEDSVTVFVRTSGPEFSVSKRLDCGIAMLHLEVAALSQGLKGQWDFLKPPLVARFTVKTGST
jgi:nitroreductase